MVEQALVRGLRVKTIRKLCVVWVYTGQLCCRRASSCAACISNSTQRYRFNVLHQLQFADARNISWDFKENRAGIFNSMRGQLLLQ
jgi:hypothetical protein